MRRAIEIFTGTDLATLLVIYHDALPQWWEAGAQAHLAARGFADRRYYKEKFMGDSPELMPLDSLLFSDLIEAVANRF